MWLLCFPACPPSHTHSHGYRTRPPRDPWPLLSHLPKCSRPIAAARHVLINTPSHSTSFDNEAATRSVWRDSGQRLAAKCIWGEEEVAGKGGWGWGRRNYSLMWEKRWCDASARLSRTLVLLLCGDQILSFLCVRSMNGAEDAQLRGWLHQAVCLGACVSTPSPNLCACLFVCLLVFSPPLQHQNSCRRDGGLLNAGAVTRHMNADKVGQESTKSTTRMFRSMAWSVCVCAWVRVLMTVLFFIYRRVKFFSHTDK